MIFLIIATFALESFTGCSKNIVEHQFHSETEYVTETIKKKYDIDLKHVALHWGNLDDDLMAPDEVDFLEETTVEEVREQMQALEWNKTYNGYAFTIYKKVEDDSQTAYMSACLEGIKMINDALQDEAVLKAVLAQTGGKTSLSVIAHEWAVNKETGSLFLQIVGSFQ